MSALQLQALQLQDYIVVYKVYIYIYVYIVRTYCMYIYIYTYTYIQKRTIYTLYIYTAIYTYAIYLEHIYTFATVLLSYYCEPGLLRGPINNLIILLASNRRLRGLSEVYKKEQKLRTASAASLNEMCTGAG